MIYDEYTINLNDNKTDSYIEVDSDENLNIDNIENDNSNEEIYIKEENRIAIGKFNVKEFNPGGGRYPGIWAIDFLGGTPIYKYGNAYAFLPISSSLIYTGTVATSIPNYEISNIFSGTISNIQNYQLNYGTPLGQPTTEETTNPVRFSGIIYCMAADSSNNIYIGGNFYIGNGVDININDLAKWSPSTNTWSKVYDFTLPNPSQSVYSIQIVGSIIYVGGDFTQVQFTSNQVPYSIDVSSFVVWDSLVNIWTNGNIILRDSVGNPASVYTMKYFNNILYVGGNIYSVQVGLSAPIFVNNIFRLGANRFSGWLTANYVGRGVSSNVYAMDTDTAGNLYVGGSFARAIQSNGANLEVRKIARWKVASPAAWQQIVVNSGPQPRYGVNNDVYAVGVNPTNKNQIWFGGLFYRDRYAGTYVSYFNWSTKKWSQRPYTKSSPGT